jgi:hypothetical protein
VTIINIASRIRAKRLSAWPRKASSKPSIDDASLRAAALLARLIDLQRLASPIPLGHTSATVIVFTVSGVR